MRSKDRSVKQNDIGGGRTSNHTMRYALAILAMTPLYAQTAEQFEAQGASLTKVMYQGEAAIRVDALPAAANGTSYAMLKGSRFHNGTIEVELAGKPAANAGEG